MMRRLAGFSSRQKARTAGGLFVLLVLVSATTEFFVRGRSGMAAHLLAGAIEVSCMVVVTLLLWDIFKPVQKQISSTAACANLLAVLLELLRIQPHGIHLGIGLHAAYWLLVAWLIFHSSFLPHILGAFLGIAGGCWLIFLCSQSAGPLARYSLASALLIQGSVMLWLLVMGLDLQQWNEQARAASLLTHIGQ